MRGKRARSGYFAPFSRHYGRRCRAVPDGFGAVDVRERTGKPVGVTITGVAPGSAAASRGVLPGDELLKVNGHEIVDVLDYRFYTAEPRLRLTLSRGGRKRLLTLHKGTAEEVGLQFETYLMDRQRSCRNRCAFCFIDQMPPGMRESLYFKDDDSRLSFLFGNYITLTNLSEREVERILAMHISPVNVSVHTTNPELRCAMMGNRFAGEKLALLRRFAEAGVRMNCQLVLCPGWNDGPELDRSLRELAALGPSVESIAAVPVGLTRYREGLPSLRLHTPEEAAAVIDQMEAAGNALLALRGARVCYAADEFYLKAGRPLPAAAFYEDFPQLENGVGMVSLLKSQFLEALSGCGRRPAGSRLTFATGTAAAPLLEELIGIARKKWPDLRAEVVPIRNDFFGETITVAGLVTGEDLIAQLKGRAGDIVVIPETMLNFEGNRFLDDVTPSEVEQSVGARLEPSPTSGEALLDAILL